jgi:hypothetical protein
LISQHTCTSSARRKTTTPTSGWVTSKAIHYLKKTPNMGPKELQEELQDKHKCEIHYDSAEGKEYCLEGNIWQLGVELPNVVQLEGRGIEVSTR